MKEKHNILSTKFSEKTRLDLSKKPPQEIAHLLTVLKRLEKEGKIRIRVAS